MAVVAKRSVMTLFSNATDVFSHRVRIVLAEKGVTFDVIDIDSSGPSVKEELMQLNPYGTSPTLVDRDLVLYQSEVIMEYLDERFPHPPLMPVYPVARGRTRMMIHRVNQDWYAPLKTILMSDNKAQVEAAKKELGDSITSVAPVFGDMPFFLSEEFSLLDCCVAPLLWRLPKLGIHLSPAQAQPVLDYCQRIFSRTAFQASLTDAERTWRMGE